VALATPNDFGLGRRQRVALALGPAGIVLLLGALTYTGVRQTQQSRVLVAHARDVVEHLHTVLSTMQDAETGQRGYILTGTPQYLEPYDHAVAELRADTTALRALTRENLEEQPQLDSLNALIRVKMTELAEAIDLRRTAGLIPTLAVVQTDRGKQTMDSIRVVLARVDDAERDVLTRHQANEAHRGRVVTLIIVLGSFFAVVLALFLTVTLVRDAETLTHQAGELSARNDQLQEQSVELELQSQQLH
jgi:CHASE3 domain sensor protein